MIVCGSTQRVFFNTDIKGCLLSNCFPRANEFIDWHSIKIMFRTTFLLL